MREILGSGDGDPWARDLPLRDESRSQSHASMDAHQIRFTILDWRSPTHKWIDAPADSPVRRWGIQGVAVRRAYTVQLQAVGMQVLQ
jgi:hypothetical protein